MSSTSPDPATPKSSPLFLPLIIVSVVAVLEAVAVAFLLAAVLSRQPSAPPAAQAGAVAQPAPAPAPAPAPSSTAGQTPANPTPKTATSANPSRGKRGQKVESAGFAITVEKIVHEPTYKEFANIAKDKRYLALLLAVENNTGRNDTIYPSQFSLKDDQGYPYGRLNLPLMSQALEWRSMGNRETVRGYVDFTVPASAKNLTLVYPRDPQPIHIDLDE